MARVYRLELEWSALADDFRTFWLYEFCSKLSAQQA